MPLERKKVSKGGLTSCNHCGNWNIVLLRTLWEAYGMQLSIVPLRGEEAKVLSTTSCPSLVEGHSWGLTCSAFQAGRPRKPSANVVTLCKVGAPKSAKGKGR